MNPALSNARHPSEDQVAYRARLRQVNAAVEFYLRAGRPVYKLGERDRNGKFVPYRKPDAAQA